MIELLTSQELMHALKVSRSTLHRLKKMGLPTVGGGKLVRFDPVQALEWFDQNSHLTSAPEMLPVGDYACRGCGYEARIEMPMAPGPCPRCGSKERPVRITAHH